MPIRSQMNPTDWGALLFLSAIWGGSFFFVEVALTGLPPLILVALRVSLAGIALWGLLALLPIPLPRQPLIWGQLWFMGLLNNAIPFTLLTFGQVYITGSLASILNATTPLFAVLVAGFLLPDERATTLKTFGVFFGLLGVVVLLAPGLFGGAATGDDAVVDPAWVVLAEIACLGAACAYAFAGVFGRRFSVAGVHPMVTAAGQLTGASLLLWPLALAVDGPSALSGLAHFDVLLSVLALAIVSTSLAYIIYFKLLGDVGATNLLLVTFLVPISATLLGVALLGEALGLFDLFGVLLIALGLSAIDGRLWRRIRPS